MRGHRRGGAARAFALAALCWAGASTAQAADPKADPVAGRAKAANERCLECHLSQPHDPERAGTSAERFPKLSGQPAEYLRKQLQDFRSGARRHDIMTAMARSLEEADIPDIAAYFTSLPALRGPAAGASAEGASIPQASPRANPQAEQRAIRLMREGDAEQGLPACAGCHGPTGREPLPGLPLIAGQERPYLEFQLLDWRNGERRNSPGQVMSQSARALSDADIRALAAYLAGQ